MASDSNDGVVVSQIAKNRRGDVLRVSLKEYEGHRFVDIRQFYTPQGGSAPVGTKKGVTVPVHLIEQMIEALLAARRKAIELGWDREHQRAA